MKILEEIVIPHESVNDEEVIIVRLFFKNGDAVKKGDELLEFESSKSVIALEAKTDGYVIYSCNEGDNIAIGSIVCKIVNVYDKKQEELIHNKFQEIETLSESEKKINNDIIPVFSKKAKQLLEEYNLKENDFVGKGFVNKDDIYLFLNPIKANNGKTLINSQKEQLLEHNIKRTDYEKKANTHIKKLDIQKIREIEYLSSVQKYGLNSSLSTYINIENVINFINTHLSLLKGSFLPIIIYEVSRVLKKFPKLNAYYQENSIIYYDIINIGIAIDLEQGLRVLNINNTNKLSLVEIEQEILNISKKYIDNSFTTQDITDTTFTITDLSNFSVASFLPLINKNNSSILAISAIDSKLNRLTLTTTFDHRVTEGKYVAEFLLELKKRIESYVLDSSPEENNTKPVIRCYKCHRKLSDNLNDNVTFFKVLDSNGEEKILCNICYEGY